MRLVAVLLAVLFATLPARAAQWVVDPAKSHLTFTALDSRTEFTGSFKTWTAKIDFDPDRLDQSSIEVTVDMASADAGDSFRNSRVGTAEWLSVKEFPKAVFTAKKVTKRADGSFEAQGELKLRGIKKSLTLPFTLTISGKTAQAKGTATIARFDYDIGKTTDDSYISAEVKIGVDLVAVAAP